LCTRHYITGSGNGQAVAGKSQKNLKKMKNFEKVKKQELLYS
jgi:hypothetical protein